MAYTEAYMLYNEATGNEEAGTDNDLTRYPAVIQAFQSFVAEHSKTGPNFLGRAHDILGRLHTEIGELALAEEAYGNLRQVDTAKTLLPMLGTVLFTAYRNEIENWQRQGTDPEALQALEQVRRKALNLGLEYAHTAALPSYGMLYNSIRIAEALEDWQTLDHLARRAIDLYGENPDYARRVDAFVRPAVARVALHGRKFQVAYHMLVAAEEAIPANYPVKRLLALTLGGWLEFDAVGNPVAVLGLERPDEAYVIYWTKYRLYALSPRRVGRFSLEWYAFHWEAYWFALQASPMDSAFADRARAIYNIARSTDDFAHLRDDLGPEGRVLWQKFTRY